MSILIRGPVALDHGIARELLPGARRAALAGQLRARSACDCCPGSPGCTGCACCCCAFCCASCRCFSICGRPTKTSESSVGSGARRIEALTAGEAYAYLHGKELEAAELRAETEKLRKQGAKTAKAATTADVEVLDESDGIVTAQVSAVKGAELRDLSDQIRQSKQADAVLLGSVDDGRVNVVVNLSAAKVDQGVDAVAIVKKMAEKIGGGGAGAPTSRKRAGRIPTASPRPMRSEGPS